MGNKRKHKKNKISTLRRLREHVNMMNTIKAKNRVSLKRTEPPRLKVICERIIKKYKLLPERKAFTPPESFSIVGGKPLRKRSKKIPSELLKAEKRRKKESNPKSLATLCRIVIDEYNILPQCEESSQSQPSSSNLIYQKESPKKRGRPRKSQTDKDVPEKKGRRRGRPRKDQAQEYREDSQTETVSYINYKTFLRESQDTRKIQLDLNRPQEIDPLQNDDDYTIEIKQEIPDDEEDNTQEDPMTVQIPQATSQGIIINPAASMEIPGVSGRTLEPIAKFATVVMDEHQMFANSIAEQLRKLPPKRALLLQLDIQSMIDNEIQLLQHES